MEFKTKTYETIDYRYCRASSGLRFANYIIDTLFIYFLVLCLGFVIAIIDPKIIDVIDDGITDRIIGMIFYGVIMSFTEAMLNGKSIGKLITKTKAVNLDGSDLTFEKAFTRNLLRIIPFDALSALGTPSIPWHDKWSDTMVIEEKKVALQQEKTDLFGSFKNQTL
ncbi:RDD family protein [Pedobacter frigidisoli]|uniref:RDD family protein n=1 Tax=Pedobacter frigidisoli TaxID=2530455 RepID=A0A4R0P6Z1_9SPHI|nr:RDD family protein [Pedobacter frigidisoli]TCD11686.1 RDD family protein [Pedobacter frigidisoli]